MSNGKQGGRRRPHSLPPRTVHTPCSQLEAHETLNDEIHGEVQNCDCGDAPCRVNVDGSDHTHRGCRSLTAGAKANSTSVPARETDWLRVVSEANPQRRVSKESRMMRTNLSLVVGLNREPATRTTGSMLAGGSTDKRGTDDSAEVEHLIIESELLLRAASSVFATRVGDFPSDDDREHTILGGSVRRVSANMEKAADVDGITLHGNAARSSTTPFVRAGDASEPMAQGRPACEAVKRLQSPSDVTVAGQLPENEVGEASSSAVLGDVSLAHDRFPPQLIPSGVVVTLEEDQHGVPSVRITQKSHGIGGNPVQARDDQMVAPIAQPQWLCSTTLCKIAKTSLASCFVIAVMFLVCWLNSLWSKMSRASRTSSSWGRLK